MEAREEALGVIGVSNEHCTQSRLPAVNASVDVDVPYSLDKPQFIFHSTVDSISRGSPWRQLNSAGNTCGFRH